MKKIIISLLVISFLVSCNQDKSNGNKASENSNPTSALNYSGPVKPESTIKMTRELFLARVMDFENNPTDWNYKGDLPCLIDFYADWCGPCKIASPVLDELAEEYAGKIYIYKVDTEVERELSAAFGIRSIPTFLFCPQDGKPTMTSGIARTPEDTKEMFRNMIEEILLKNSNS